MYALYRMGGWAQKEMLDYNAIQNEGKGYQE